LSNADEHPDLLRPDRQGQPLARRHLRDDQQRNRCDLVRSQCARHRGVLDVGTTLQARALPAHRAATPDGSVVMRTTCRTRGMTLIEVMVALGLASVGMLGALAMVGASMRGGSFSRNMTEASVLVQSKLESELLRTGVTQSSPQGTTTESSLDALGTV